MTIASDSISVERVQLGVRMEKRLVKVLKGLAEFNNQTLGQLLENIVLHSFVPLAGQEGEYSASPHGKRALAALNDLKRVYGMDYDEDGLHRFKEKLVASAATDGDASQLQGG